MSWQPTHTFDGVECVLSTPIGQDHAYVYWSERHGVSDRIPRILWDRHAKPITTVGTATLPWVSVKDAPHPTDGTDFLALRDDGFIFQGSGYYTDAAITHWCHLPKENPTKPV